MSSKFSDHSEAPKLRSSLCSSVVELKRSISGGWIVSLWESRLGHFCVEKIMHCFQRSSTDHRLTDSVQHYLVS